MILHAVLISLLLACGVILNLPMLRKPFSEDDGNWFYPAVFRDRGLKLQDFKWRYSFFGVHWLGIAARLLTGRSDAPVFYGLKILWYSLTAAAIYILAVAFWNEPATGFLGGLFFLVAAAVPATLFNLTYGEHFFNLPVLSAMSLFALAGDGNFLPFALGAGLLMAWAFHMKPPVLLAVVWMPVMAFLGPEPLLAIAAYAAGFVLLNLLPALYIGLRGGPAGGDLLLLFGSFLIMARKAADRMKFGFAARVIDKLLARHEQSEGIETYIDGHHGLSWRDQWRSFASNMKPAALALRFVLILAAAQAVQLFFRFDPFVLAVLSIAVVYLLMQQVQKNYYTPHFNAAWAPLGLLAAKTVTDVFPVWHDNLPAAILIILALGLEATRAVMAVRAGFKAGRVAVFGARSPQLDRLFVKCQEIGAFIRENSNPGDRLFVWGDQPSIYLYSHREIFKQDYLILYAHNNRLLRLKELTDDLWKTPPEFILFYNYKVNDGWNMERVQDTIGVKYGRVDVFQVTDPTLITPQNPKGVFFEAPLFRRNDEHYRWVLLERAALELRKGAVDRAEARLKTVLEIFPDDFEAMLMMKLIEMKSSASNGKLNGSIKTFLETEMTRQSDEGRRSVLLKKLGEIEAAAGRLAEARGHFSQALNRNPADPGCLTALGQVLFLDDSKEEAARCFQKAIELDGYSAETLNSIGVILAERGRTDDAVNALKKAHAYMPDHPAVLDNMRRLTGQPSA